MSWRWLLCPLRRLGARVVHRSGNARSSSESLARWQSWAAVRPPAVASHWELERASGADAGFLQLYVFAFVFNYVHMAAARCPELLAFDQVCPRARVRPDSGGTSRLPQQKKYYY